MPFFLADNASLGLLAVAAAADLFVGEMNAMSNPLISRNHFSLLA